MANARTHATTKERPDHRLALERTALFPLPQSVTMARPTPRSPLPTPFESLQHPLSIYNELLQVTP